MTIEGDEWTIEGDGWTIEGVRVCLGVRHKTQQSALARTRRDTLVATRKWHLHRHANETRMRHGRIAYTLPIHCLYMRKGGSIVTHLHLPCLLGELLLVEALQILC